MGNRERAQHSPVAANDEGEPEDIDPAHLADVLESLAQAKRRQFATAATLISSHMTAACFREMLSCASLR